MALLFNKKLPPSCSYCVYGKQSVFENEIVCAKNGITFMRDSCRKFKYDPLKRTPEKIKISDNYNSEDFKL
jgi:hypothetical protein